MEQQKWRVRHREELIQYARDYYSKNKEYFNAKRRQNYQDNREREREYHRMYQKEHQEYLKEYNKNYYEKNKSMKQPKSEVVVIISAKPFTIDFS